MNEEMATEKQIEYYGHLGITEKTTMKEARAKIDAFKAQKNAPSATQSTKANGGDYKIVREVALKCAVEIEVANLGKGFITNRKETLDLAEAFEDWINRKT